ncbi:spermatogenesis-associated protein 31D4 isoform X2 [Zalophus californianus]|uniref:Spermatogenesis-associated protein 31D4 isoform X2 n=1 Tax=Zalophus californianus TaxID=9704 RepID=A0A6P9FC32_ZALCA|nr:spermatogenesis-associated protein 31D4 isoform X2 [Zalophus californianus]
MELLKSGIDGDFEDKDQPHGTRKAGSRTMVLQTGLMNNKRKPTRSDSSSFLLPSEHLQRQGRAKRRRKGGTLKDYRCYQREVEEAQKLISVLRSPVGRHHDTISFHQLLCPDPSCEVCNRTTAEINRLLFPEALEDATPLASTAPVTSSSFTLSPDSSAVPPGDLISASLPEPSPPPASTFSPNPVTPLADFFPPSPPGGSLPPESFPPLHSEFPKDSFPPQSLAFPPIPPNHAQTVDPVVHPEATLSLNTIFCPDSALSQDVNPLPELSQMVNPTETFACHNAPPTLSVSPPPDCSLTMTQPKSISISKKPVPEISSPDSSGGLPTYVPTITGFNPSRLSILDFPSWQTHAKDFFPSTLAPYDFHQEFLALHSSEASSGEDPAAKLVEPANLSLLSPDGLALLEEQVRKRSDFWMWKEMKKSSVPKQTIAEKHDLEVSLPFWSSKDQSKELHVHRQPPYPTTTLKEGHLQQTPIQFFWGLPTLHSESLFSVAHVLDNCSSILIFNRVSNASTEQESPVVPHPLPLSLPQPQPLPIPQVQPQAHLQSPLPILSSGPLTQVKVCGVCLHRPEMESESLIPNEMQHLEWNVLQKEQETVWGLPTVVQRSQEDFCPSAPKPLTHQASQARVAISILPGQFPLTDELRRKLERHLRKRLIQHQWGLSRRICKSLSLMGPSIFSETPNLQRYHGRTWISKSESKSSKSESDEGDSEMSQLEDDDLEKDNDDLEKDQRHNPENGPKDYLLSDPESSSGNDMGYDSEKELRRPSEKNSTVSVETIGRGQFENVLKIHLSKKCEEINEGQLPGPVHNSWHTMTQTSLLFENSHTEIKHRSLPPSEVQDYSLNTFRELPFLESSAQQMLEAHIKRFRMMMTQGLPSRVLESIELFKLIKDTSHSSFSSSTNLISELNSKPGGFNSLRGSSKSLHGDKVGTANSASILDRPLPAASTVGKEEQRSLRQSPSDINHELAEDVQKIKDGTQTLTPVKHDTIGNRWPPKLPAREAGAGHEPKDKSANSGGRGGMQQGKKNLEPVFVPTVSRVIFRVKELDAHQSQSNILTTSKPVSSQTIKVNVNKAKTTIPIKSPPPNISIPQDPKSSKLKQQLLCELKFKLEEREHSRAQAHHTGLPPASDSLTYKASLTHAQGVSSGDMGASQVLHVHTEDTGINMEQQQEPGVRKHVLRKCQNKNLPPAAVTMSPPGSKAQELGGGDAGLGTSQPKRNSFPTEDVALNKRFPTQDVLSEKPGSKPSQTLSQNGQPPPESLSQKGQPPSESHCRKKMKRFLQWLKPGIKCKRQENSQEKGSPRSSVESRGLLKGRTAFTGATEARKIVTDGTFLEEKMGRWHAIDSTCPQQPIPFPTKYGKTQQKAQVQAQAQPVQGHTGNIRQIRDKDRQPQKAVAFKDQRLHPLSMPHREPAPHPHATCRHQAGQGPPATLTTAGGTVFRDLPLLFRQKTLLQNFHGGIFPTPK